MLLFAAKRKLPVLNDCVQAHIAFLTKYSPWLAAQRGHLRSAEQVLGDGQGRYIWMNNNQRPGSDIPVSDSSCYRETSQCEEAMLSPNCQLQVEAEI